MEALDEVDLGGAAEGSIVVHKRAEHDLNFNIQEDNGHFTITDLDASEELMSQIKEGKTTLIYAFQHCTFDMDILVELWHCFAATIDYLNCSSFELTLSRLKPVPVL